MNIQQIAPSLRDQLQRDVGRGVAELAELAGKYANDRDLVFRAVLLKRELANPDAAPSQRQIDQGIEILEQLIVDQSRSQETAGATRHEAAEAARERALAIPVPDAVVIEGVELVKGYRRGGFTLKNVSLEARYGEIIGVVGRNGNGKTTLFRLIVGELRPDSGLLKFPAIQSADGRVRWSQVRRQIAYVPQDLPPWYGSLRSNLHYEAAVHGVRSPENEREVEYIIERLGLREHVDKRWNELSGGFKMRFALARALVWKPKLLVLDEPLANLDFVTQQIVLKDLRHLTDSLRYPLALIVSSQHVHEIEEISDKLLVLSGGAVKYFGAVDAIGAERLVNRFELGGRTELSDLEAAFSGADYLSVYYSGVAFVLTTSTKITPDAVLRRIIEHRLPITYFRDISRSSKALVGDDAAAR